MRHKRRIFIVLTILACLGATAWGLRFAAQTLSDYQLPKERLNFAKLKPRGAQSVEDLLGRVLFYRYGPNLVLYRPLNQISPLLQDYVVMLEDGKFFSHNGFDVEEIKNSLEKNMQKRKVTRGASTISQQLAKNMFLDKERSWTRKLFEIPWTMRIEKDLSKKQILDLYFNVIEWGPGLHGAEAASRHYFDKHADELGPGEAMYLALIVPNPVRFDLFAHPRMENFLNQKRRWLVERLVNEHKITAEEKERYLALPFGLVPPDSPGRRFAVAHDAPYFGNRGQRSEPWATVEKLLPKSAWRRENLRLTLDKALCERLALAELESSGLDGAHYAVIREDNQLRALRPLAGGQSIGAATVDAFADEGLEVTEESNVDGAQLLRE